MPAPRTICRVLESYKSRVSRARQNTAVFLHDTTVSHDHITKAKGLKITLLTLSQFVMKNRPLRSNSVSPYER